MEPSPHCCVLSPKLRLELIVKMSISRVIAVAKALLVHRVRPRKTEMECVSSLNMIVGQLRYIPCRMVQHSFLTGIFIARGSFRYQNTVRLQKGLMYMIYTLCVDEMAYMEFMFYYKHIFYYIWNLCFTTSLYFLIFEHPNSSTIIVSFLYINGIPSRECE